MKDLKKQNGLNSPLPIKWTKEINEWHGIFNLNEIKYEIFIQNKSDTQTHFLFKFHSDGKYDTLSDAKKSFSVIPTLEGAAMEFIKEVQPQAFMFFELDESDMRKMMYDKFCINVSKKMKYRYIKPDSSFYILVKEDGMKGIIRSMLKIVTERM